MSYTASKRLRALAAAAGLCAGLGAGAASAANVNRVFTIATADIVDLYSATFDGSLLPCPAPASQECTFFGGSLPAGRAIVITPTGTGSGTLDVNYDTVTGEITQVNSLLINLPALTLVITNPAAPSPTVTTVVVTPGNAVPVANDVPFVESGTGTAGRDLDGSGFGLVLGAGTADADQAPVVGVASVFHHTDPTLPIPIPDAPDFGVFSDIVDSCNDVGPNPACPLITLNLLTLDAVRYRLEGRIGCTGAPTSLVLKSQTANGSIHRVNLTTTIGLADCDGDGVLNAADNCPDESNAGQADQDADGRGNVCDNCRNVANNSGAAAQCNSDADAFGNRCDGDFNNNGFTNAQDNTLFKGQLGKPSVAPVYIAADINCNGFVNAQDNTIFKTLLGSPPGPGPGP